MNQTDFINILLAVLGFIGVMAVKQLMKIATSIGEIKEELSGLVQDHTNLKDSHKELKERVTKLEDR